MQPLDGAGTCHCATDAQDAFFVDKRQSAMYFWALRKQIQNQHPSLCAPWLAYVVPPSEGVCSET